MRKTVRVFIENEAGSHTKNLHDEKALVHVGSIQVSRPYPFPYGFLIATTNEDGDSLDCFVLTNQPLKRGTIVECEVVGLMEQTENGAQDNNILATLASETVVVDDDLQSRMREFVSHVFDHMPARHVRAGRFLGAPEALQLIEACSEI
jgi:inorganic pyrophosphatase